MYDTWLHVLKFKMQDNYRDTMYFMKNKWVNLTNAEAWAWDTKLHLQDSKSFNDDVLFFIYLWIVVSKHWNLIDAHIIFS